MGQPSVHGVLRTLIQGQSNERLTEREKMSETLLFENKLKTIGGRITCLQCNAKSKRTGIQCRAPATKGKTKCRFHGGASTGPKTEQGRQRCAEAKTIHGNETRKARTERAAAMRQLRALEDLGHALGIMHGGKIRGRKPSVNQSCTSYLNSSLKKIRNIE